MIQALLLLASVLGASVYYWQHNREWSYIQTLENVNPKDVLLPKYDVHPILFNKCAWPILEPNESDIQTYIKKKKRRTPTCAVRQDIDIEWHDSNIRISINNNINNTIECFAYDLSAFSSTESSLSIKLDIDTQLEIPYSSFVVECSENKKIVKRKSFYNLKKAQIEESHDSVESSSTSPSVSVLYFKSMSHSQLHRELPKTLKASKQFNFNTFSMFNKVSNNISETVNITFGTPDVQHMLGQYMKNRYCRAFNNDDRSGVESNYDLSMWTKSMKLDSCSDENTLAGRLIDEWAKFAMENTGKCHFSNIWIDNVPGSANIDDSLSRAIEQFQLGDVFKDTVVVIMSAEGIPVGHFGNRYTGRVEERNPMLMVHVPEKVKKVWPDHMFHLEQNQNRLITHRDVFEMLNSFARLTKGQPITPVDSDILGERLEKKRGFSIWQSLIPHNRTCVDAMIPEEFCLCMVNKPDIENDYKKTTDMSSRVFDLMEHDILSNKSCVVGVGLIEERNHTQVFNLNEKVLEGADEHVEFIYHGVRAIALDTKKNKDLFLNVIGQFKHDLKDVYSIKKTYRYAIDGVGMGCMAGYLDRFCEMCYESFLLS